MTVSTPLSPAPLRVLAVDDNAALLRFLVSGLGACGCAVSAASTAEQAMAMLEQESFDLVLSDIRMPGLSGLEVQRELARLGETVPIVVITAFDEHESRAQCLAAGAAAYLLKPFDDQALLDAIGRAVGGSASSGR